jgi:hypothetical protein
VKEWQAETPEQREVYRKWLLRPQKRTPHTSVKRKRLAWALCSSCGLLYLKNPATATAIRAGCVKD